MDDEDSYAFRYWLLSGLSGGLEEVLEEEEEQAFADIFDFVEFQDDLKSPKVAEK